MVGISYCRHRVPGKMRIVCPLKQERGREGVHKTEKKTDKKNLKLVLFSIGPYIAISYIKIVSFLIQSARAQTYRK